MSDLQTYDREVLDELFQEFEEKLEPYLDYLSGVENEQLAELLLTPIVRLREIYGLVQSQSGATQEQALAVVQACQDLKTCLWFIKLYEGL